MTSLSLSICSFQPQTLRLRASCRVTHLRLTVRHHYWDSRCGKPYAGESFIYKHHAYFPRYLKYRHAQEIKYCDNVKDSLALAPFARFSSSWRNHDDSKPGKECNQSKESQEMWREARTHIRDIQEIMHKDHELAIKLLRDFVEKDPYAALFGSREARGAWNPWSEVERWWTNTSRHSYKNASSAESEEQPTGKSDSASQSSKNQHTSSDRGEAQPAMKDKNSSQVSDTSLCKDSAAALPKDNCGASKASIDYEEFTIDPITMKRVLKAKRKSPSRQDDLNQPEKPKTPSDNAKAIPVNNFEPRAMSDLEKQEVQALRPDQDSTSATLAGFASQPWLVRDGFSNNVSSSIGSLEPKSDAHQGKAKSVRPKIQPSLDRIARPSEDHNNNLKYDISEDRVEDIDLLRASDVRAASGHTKKQPQLSPEKTQERRAMLENSFANAERNYVNEMQSTLTELTESRTVQTKEQDTSLKRDSATEVNAKQVNRHYEELQRQMKLAAKILKEARKNVADHKLALEVKAQCIAFDEFENRRRKQLSAATQVFESSQNLRSSTELGDRATIGRRRKDMELVREIRHIYESEYGPISTKHRQPFRNKKPQEPPEGTMVSKYVSPSPKVEFYEVDADAPPKSTSLKDSSDGREDIARSPKQVFVPLDVAAEAETPCVQALPDHVTGRDAPKAEPKTKSQTLAQKALEPNEPSLSFSDKGVNSMSKANDVPERKPETSYLYTILALDRLTDEVKCATTTSSIHEPTSPIRSASSILTHLEKPWLYFKYMEVLDKEGYRLVSGNRGNLVYRKQLLEETSTIELDSVKAAPERTSYGSDVEDLARVLRPIREEPVFSGPPTPQERIVRAYQRASRAWPAIEEQVRGKERESSRTGTRDVESKIIRRNKARRSFRGLFSKVGTVGLAVLVCYLVGIIQGNKNQRDAETRVVREKQIELERQRKEKERGWF